MRFLTTAILFIQITSSCLGQNISLNDLFSICNKPNWAEINTIMTKKGWEYYESKEGDTDHFQTIVWSFHKSEYSEKAQGWFNLYTAENVPEKIKYDFFSKQIYEAFQKNTETLRLNRTSSTIKDDYIQTQYSNNQFNIKIKISKVEKVDSFEEVTMPAYSVEITKKNGLYDESNGIKRSYFDDGTLKNEYALKDGSINGPVKSFYPNGKPRNTSFFVNNILHGAEKNYDENGILTSEYNYVNGIRDGIYKIFKEGKIIQIGFLKKDVHHGTFKDYDEYGNITKEFFMKDGMQHGAYREMIYKEKIKVLEEVGQYQNDEEAGRWEIFKIYQGKRSDLLKSVYYSNGIKQGTFKEVKSDSIIFGSYNDDKLDGPFYVYTKLSYLFNGEVSGDTAGCPLTITGSYKHGLKNGKWKYFDFAKNLIKEGSYENGLEHGEWKYYFRKMLKNKKETAFSKMMFLTEQYKHGKLEGKSTRLAYQEDYKIPCGPTDILLKNTADSCLRTRYKKIYILQTYKNDTLNGTSEVRDSSNILVSKGEYKNGQRNGPWVQNFVDLDTTGEKHYRKFEGSYLFGQRHGIWKEYKEHKLVSEIEFNRDQRHGKSISYDWGKNEFSEHNYEQGTLTRLIIYKSITKKDTTQIFDIKNESNELLCYQLTTYQNGIKISRKEYKLIKEGNEIIDAHSFAYLHWLRSYPDGRFEEYDKQGRITEEGSQHENKKIKLWRFYNYDLNFIVEQDFELTEIENPVEHFIFLSSRKPYNGTIVRKYSNGNPMYEVKIKNGLRDGKSKEFDEQGHILKIEKYRAGLAVN